MTLGHLDLLRQTCKAGNPEFFNGFLTVPATPNTRKENLWTVKKVIGFLPKVGIFFYFALMFSFQRFVALLFKDTFSVLSP